MSVVSEQREACRLFVELSRFVDELDFFQGCGGCEVIHCPETQFLLLAVLLPVLRCAVVEQCDAVEFDACEVVGMKDGNIKLKEIFAFKQKGVTKNNEVIGEFVMYKYTPKVYEKIKRAGITTLVDLFE